MPKRHSSLRDRQRWLKQRLAPEQAGNDLGEAGVHVFEKHYTVNELAEIWGLSRDFLTKLFENEPGVLTFGSESECGKRRYLTIRIPKSVAERVHRRHLRAER